MKAICWYGVGDVRLKDVPEPRILQPTDAVIEVTSAAICGSDLHIYDGYVPTMKKGDILGHEAMGIVREVGDSVERVEVGDRIVVPFPIACGHCWYCENDLWSLCDNTNPNAAIPEALYGATTAGQYGYSHAFGGFAGGQAEFLRVPFADTCHTKIPDNLTDDQVLFLSDILPTGWWAADCADVEPGDSVAVWGAGPVGQFAMLAARVMGAEEIFAIDFSQRRLKMAERYVGAVPLDRGELGLLGVQKKLKLLTGGRGPDGVIDATGMESGGGALGWYHKAKQTLRLEQDRPVALTEAIMACRKAGTVSVPGVFTGLIDKFPMGAVFAKALTLRGGQAPVQAYAEELLQLIDCGAIDPTFVITHHVPLEEVPQAYKMFRDEKDEAVKIVIRP
ncbi:MAG: zinc-dependent alcohol dehydrogenase [Coriobacteriia bacterium]